MHETLVLTGSFLVLCGFIVAFILMHKREERLIRELEENLLSYTKVRGYELQRATWRGWGGINVLSTPPLLRARKNDTEVLVDLRHSVGRLKKNTIAVGEPRWMNEESGLGINSRSLLSHKGPKPDPSISWEGLKRHFKLEDNTTLPNELVWTEDLRLKLTEALPYGAAFSLLAYNTTTERTNFKMSHSGWYMSKQCVCYAHVDYAFDEMVLDTLIGVVAAVCRDRTPSPGAQG